MDSATGYAVQPETVEARPHGPGLAPKRLGAAQIGRNGRAGLALERGRHMLTAVSPGHRPMSGEFEMTPDNPYAVDFYLDPLEGPEETRPEVVAGLLRDSATLLQGFVADDDAGEPLAGVRVTSLPSGAETGTDERGFFRFYVPAPDETQAGQTPANLVFEKPGYRTLERQNLELWSRGDWTYRIRLERGHQRQVVDENTQRRRAPEVSTPSGTPTLAQTADAGIASSEGEVWPPILDGPLADGPIEPATASSNATVRVPRNIRVLRADNVTIDYVTMLYYTRCVLPSEWIPSWANYTGGSNSLNAGAVAARCYAIARINTASGTSTYDICATTSCQVYDPAKIHSLTDVACNFTANWVVINSSGAVPSTEYSAENNSLGYSCGDGFTQPTGGCVFDPVCTGETRYGHGRGMCQWGTAKWATGRKMAGRNSGDATPNGYPRRDWQWIVQHYYPTLTLVKGAPLVIGDDVKALKTLDVRACPGGEITNGYNCALVTTKSVGATGVIIGGPTVVTNDGKGFTWYQVQWSDAVVGWSAENFLERVFGLPTAPTSLTATAAGTNQIDLTWTDTTDVEVGFEMDRAISASGPWTQLAAVAANVTTYADKNLYPGSTWHYRVRAFNAGGDSVNSSLASATTSNVPPSLPVIADKIVTEDTTLTFTNAASAADFVKLLTDFENFRTDETNGLPLFRNPRYSGSTSANLDATPDLTIVTDVFATNGHGTGRVLRVNCSFTNATNPWLRLTTSGAANWPNPVIVFTNKLRFDIYADKAAQVAVGCRETTVAAGTPIGSDGGTTGGIEWAGVTNVSGSAPMPNRAIAASNWTTLTFDFPNEPIRNFSGGNGVLSTASGLGVLEHLAMVPTGGTGVCNFYLDNFAVLTRRALTYSLAPGAPTNTSVHPTTGVFTWTPSEAQGPATNTISVIVTDNSSPSLSVTQSFSVVVTETNLPPVLAAISNRMAHAGSTIVFTNTATDPDLPPNLLTFSLDPGAPPPASVGTNDGVFMWPTTDADAGATNTITVRVTDNGWPPLSDTKSFAVGVLPRPTLQQAQVAGGNFVLTWSAISGTTYRVQFKTNLADPGWTDLVPDVTAGGVTASTSDPLGPAQRFYRVLVIGPQ